MCVWSQEGGDLFPEKDGKTLYSDVDFVDTWKEMEKLVDQGLTKSIGVSNFNSEQLERILANARIKPVTNQVCILRCISSVHYQGKTSCFQGRKQRNVHVCCISE
jgi:diketogulonate reductase-like aldo/keto reductase